MVEVNNETVMSEGESTDQASAQPSTTEQDFTIEVLRGETPDGAECWEATTAAASSTAAGPSATAAEALRRLAVVRARQHREWDGDAWVEYAPQSAVSVRESTPQFTVSVQAFAKPDEHGRRWSARTDESPPQSWACGRTVGETLRQFARDLAGTSRDGRVTDSSARPSLPEHQAETLLESSRGTVYRAEATTRVAACFDRDGYMIGLPKLFVDGEAVGARQDVEWPDGIVLSVDRPGIVYDDLRRQFDVQLEASD